MPHIVIGIVYLQYITEQNTGILLKSVEFTFERPHVCDNSFSFSALHCKKPTKTVFIFSAP